MNLSSNLSIAEMQEIQGGKWATWKQDVTCIGSAVLFVAACASPFGWAAAVVVAGSGAQVITSCY